MSIYHVFICLLKSKYKYICSIYLLKKLDAVSVSINCAPSVQSALRLVTFFYKMTALSARFTVCYVCYETIFVVFFIRAEKTEILNEDLQDVNICSYI